MGIALMAGVNGVVLSSIYIMVAIGFALLLSIMGIFNFAHGAIYMVGAFITYSFAVSLGLNQWVSLLVAVIIIGAFGLFLERFCFRPFGANVFSVIVMCIALSMILEGVVVVTAGGSIRAVPPFFPGNVHAGAVSVSIDRLVTTAAGVVLLTILTLFIQRTNRGQQMLAVAQDREGATLQGVDINRTAAIACVIACALAALSGSLMASLYSLDPFMGDSIFMKAMEIVILSGIGSFGGILAGGAIIGFMDAILPLVVASHIDTAITLAILIIILLVRPKGLFGYELF
jgi:branched-chain amino acid transport system permease protein